MIRFLPVLCATLLLGGCATRHKVYHAPDASKVNRSTQVLNEKVAQARATAGKAKQATIEAQASAERQVAMASDIKAKLEILWQKAPPELKPLIEDLRTTDSARDQEAEVGRAKLREAVAWNVQLEQHQREEETARVQLQKDQSDYAEASGSLAQDATNEREERIKLEKQLSWYRWHKWLLIIGGVIVLGLVGVGIFLKFTGRLALSAAKVAAI